MEEDIFIVCNKDIFVISKQRGNIFISGFRGKAT